MPPDSHTVRYEPRRDLLALRSLGGAGGASVSNTWNSAVISAFETTNDALGRRTDRQDSGEEFNHTQTNVLGYKDRSEVASAAQRKPIRKGTKM